MPNPTTPQEVFDIIPSLADPAALRGITARLQFDVNGEGGGQWVVGIADGQVTVEKGTTPSPNVTVTTSAADYMALINGQLKPMTAFMQGKLKVKGDMALVMKLQSLFGRK